MNEERIALLNELKSDLANVKVDAFMLPSPQTSTVIEKLCHVVGKLLDAFAREQL